MGKPLKYKIGDIINDWTIKDIIYENHLSYIVKCKCGYETIKRSNKLRVTKSCHKCAHSKNSLLKIGQVYNSHTILDKVSEKGKTCYLVLCKCGKKLNKSANQLKRFKNCRSCVRGYYPGLIINGCLLQERINKCKWKIKCHCGIIYFGSTGKRFKDCGCTKIDNYLEKAKKKIGYKFGKLKVIKVEKAPFHNILVCKCKCGNIIKIQTGHELKQNSCGCLKNENSPRGEDKGNARFKNNDIISMRELYSTKLYSKDEISKMFNIDPKYLSRIINGTIWKSLPNSLASV